MMKKCSICGVAKEFNERNFPKNNSAKNKLEKRCKECKREYDAKRYQEKKEKILQQKREYYQKNKEKIKSDSLAYYKSNTEKCQQSEKSWRLKNPEKRRITCVKSRTISFGAESNLTEEQWIEVKQEFDSCCAYCGISEKDNLNRFKEQLHHEHIVPLIDKGAYCIGNVVPSCRSCNSSKKNKDFYDWYPTSKGYSKSREQKIIDYIKKYKERS